MNADRFALEPGTRRWIARASAFDLQEDFDVAVADRDGKVHDAALALLTVAVSDRAQLVREAAGHLRGWCESAAPWLASQPDLVELAVLEAAGTLHVLVSVHYAEDVYGLWSVRFSRPLDRQWYPVAFGRQAW